MNPMIRDNIIITNSTCHGIAFRIPVPRPVIKGNRIVGATSGISVQREVG
jgi:hypothetical protein